MVTLAEMPTMTAGMTENIIKMTIASIQSKSINEEND